MRMNRRSISISGFVIWSRCIHQYFFPFCCCSLFIYKFDKCYRIIRFVLCCFWECFWCAQTCKRLAFRWPRERKTSYKYYVVIVKCRRSVFSSSFHFFILRWTCAITCFASEWAFNATSMCNYCVRRNGLHLICVPNVRHGISVPFCTMDIVFKWINLNYCKQFTYSICQIEKWIFAGHLFSILWNFRWR